MAPKWHPCCLSGPRGRGPNGVEYGTSVATIRDRNWAAADASRMSAISPKFLGDSGIPIDIQTAPFLVANLGYGRNKLRIKSGQREEGSNGAGNRTSLSSISVRNAPRRAMAYFRRFRQYFWGALDDPLPPKWASSRYLIAANDGPKNVLMRSPICEVYKANYLINLWKSKRLGHMCQMGNRTFRGDAIWRQRAPRCLPDLPFLCLNGHSFVENGQSGILRVVE